MFPLSIIVIPQVRTEKPQLDHAGTETPRLDVQKIEIATPQQIGRNKQTPVESKTRTHNGRVRSARRTAHGEGRAKLVRTGCRHFDGFGSQASL